VTTKELEPEEIRQKRLKRAFFLSLGAGVILLGMKFFMNRNVISQSNFPGQDQVEDLTEDIYGKVLGLLGKKETTIEQESVSAKNMSEVELDQGEITSKSGQVAGMVETVEKTTEQKMEETIELFKELPEKQMEKVKKEIMGEICEEICGIE